MGRGGHGTAPRHGPAPLPALTGGVEQAGVVAVQLDALLAVLGGVCQRRDLGPGGVPVLHGTQVGLVHAGTRHPRGVVAVVPYDRPCPVLCRAGGVRRSPQDAPAHSIPKPWVQRESPVPAPAVLVRPPRMSQYTVKGLSGPLPSGSMV